MAVVVLTLALMPGGLTQRIFSRPPLCDHFLFESESCLVFLKNRLAEIDVVIVKNGPILPSEVGHLTSASERHRHDKSGAAVTPPRLGIRSTDIHTHF